MTFSHTDLLNLALVTSAAAREAYADERLTSAASYYHLAARIWAELGSDTNAKRHSVMADAIANEMIELASGDAECVA